MPYFMTSSANRNNIEPMFGFMALIMVVVLCLLSARTYHSFYQFYFSCQNSIMYSIYCFVILRKTLFPPFVASIIGNHTFFALMIAFFSGFSFFAFLISTSGGFIFWFLVKFFYARFTVTAKAIEITFVFVELGSWMKFLASRTLFCYDCFRHGFFLIKKLCLEPLQTQYLCGSLYSTPYQQKYNKKIKNCEIIWL